MAALVLDASATLVCAHGGTVTPGAGDPRVSIAGAPALRAADLPAVSGCPHQPPCITVRLTGSARLSASGMPLALASGMVAEPGGGPVVAASLQSKVVAG